MSLFNKKSEDFKAEKNEIKRLCGGFVSNDIFKNKALENGLSSTTSNMYYKDILIHEVKNHGLNKENIENRLDELLKLDIDTLRFKIKNKKEDTSKFRTQEDINKFMGEEYISKRLKIEETNSKTTKEKEKHWKLDNMDKELIIIIIGALISLTLYGVFIGVPLVLIGAYLLNKKQKNNTKEYTKKKQEMENIDKKLKEMEEEKVKEIEEKHKNNQVELDNIIKNKQTEITKIDNEIKELEKQLVKTKDEFEIQGYGIYEPQYDFINATAYKERLDEIRKKQKQLIKDGKATTDNPNFILNGDLKKGQKMIKDLKKQIIRTFNIECEGTIQKVKHSNLENSRKRILNSYSQLNKLNNHLNINIQMNYLNLKLEEMAIAYEYELKKQEEKELLKEAREKERENKKLQKKLEKEKNKFNHENDRINSEINKYKKQLSVAATEEKEKLEAEIQKLNETLNKNNAELDKIDELEKTPGAGYVYIISNIGSFGENVFKIGVTRRDNPEERVRELSSASVPFKYDAHVFIFSEDAYNLENELHQRFDKQRVNKVNKRKEFFNINIDDVKQIVEENKTAIHSFVEKAEADEFYDTKRIEETLN